MTRCWCSGAWQAARVGAGIDVVATRRNVAGGLCLIEFGRPDVVVLETSSCAVGETMAWTYCATSCASTPDQGRRPLELPPWNRYATPTCTPGASRLFDKSMEFTKARDWIAALLAPTSPGNATAPTT